MAGGSALASRSSSRFRQTTILLLYLARMNFADTMRPASRRDNHSLHW
jgi:hypothetical protein